MVGDSHCSQDLAICLRHEHTRLLRPIGHPRQMLNIEVISMQMTPVNVGSNGEIPYLRILLRVSCADQNRS